MNDVYFISNDGYIILIIPKDEFHLYFDIINGDSVKSKEGIFLDIDYFLGCDTLSYGTFQNSYNVLGYYFLYDDK